LHATLQEATKKRLQPRYYVYLGIVMAVAAILGWSFGLLASAASSEGLAIDPESAVSGSGDLVRFGASMEER